MVSKKVRWSVCGRRKEKKRGEKGKGELGELLGGEKGGRAGLPRDPSWT
jgi:hypothetical protein